MPYQSVQEAVEAIITSKWDGIRRAVKLARSQGLPVVLRSGELDERYDPSRDLLRHDEKIGPEEPQEIVEAEQCIARHQPQDALPYLGLDDWRVRIFVARGLAYMTGYQKTVIAVLRSRLELETDELVKRNLQWAIELKEADLEASWVMHLTCAGITLLLVIVSVATLGSDAWLGGVGLTLAWTGSWWYYWKISPIEFEMADWAKSLAKAEQ